MVRVKKGFTLIELLVVIAIIAILAAILFPVFSRARENARKATCLSNAKQIAMAFMMYAQDWDECIPSWNAPCWWDFVPPEGDLFWTEKIMPYLKNVDIFRCPSANVEWEWPANCYPGRVGRPQNNIRCNYGFQDLLLHPSFPHNIALLSTPAEAVVIADCYSALLTTAGVIWSGEGAGIHALAAFANYDGSGDITCCPGAVLHIPLADAIKKYTRHTEGSVLIFADGHAKWYKAEQIKSKSLGGTLIIHCCDFISQ